MLMLSHMYRRTQDMRSRLLPEAPPEPPFLRNPEARILEHSLTHAVALIQQYRVAQYYHYICRCGSDRKVSTIMSSFRKMP